MDKARRIRLTQRRTRPRPGRMSRARAAASRDGCAHYQYSAAELRRRLGIPAAQVIIGLAANPSGGRYEITTVSRDQIAERPRTARSTPPAGPGAGPARRRARQRPRRGCMSWFRPGRRSRAGRETRLRPERNGAPRPRRPIGQSPPHRRKVQPNGRH